MIDVMIITHNEALNLPPCLEALQGWTRKIFVIDSGSTDDTMEIARGAGAEIIHHDWEGYAKQKNWGLRNLPLESGWVLLVDADEVITEGVRQRLLQIASQPVESVPENGFFINRLTYFMGKPIRHCGYFPSWNMRFFKRGKGFYEDREVHEHIVIEDPVGYVKEAMIHDDRRGLEHYIAKHNRYSTLEARSLFDEMTDRGPSDHEANVSKETRRRRWLKRWVMPHVPFPGLWRFLYVYFIRLGLLDGRVGLEFCRFISMYDSMVAMKLWTLRYQARAGGLPETGPSSAGSAEIAGLAIAEGGDPLITPVTENGEVVQMHPEPSPWSIKERIGRAIWMLVGQPIFRLSFHNWYGFRARLLRLFGAKVGRDVAIRPSANIEVPWMIDIREGATVGDHAILYSLGPIQIGRRAIISQYAHLCAGTHDYTDHTFKLIRTPITIGDDVWIGADAFVGPGVTVGSLSVLGALSAYKPLDAKTVYVGNPARALKERNLR